MFHKVVENDMEYIINHDITWEKLRNSTVLLTGANGMIASYLIYTLLYLNEKKSLNIKVLGLVRNQAKAENHFCKLLERDDFSLIVQDVCLPVAYAGDIDYIIHAASQASPRDFCEDPVGTIKSNTVGTMQMLDLAVAKKAKGFLYLSTREIYGEPITAVEFITEEEYGVVNPMLVRSCYPESKRMAENLCSSYRHQYDVHTKVARIAHTYGPGIAVGDGRVVNDFLYNILHKEDIIMNSDGSKILSLTYLSDTVTGLFMYMLDVEEPVCNISAERYVLSVKDLAELLVRIFADRKIKAKFKAVSEIEKMGYLQNKVALLSSHKIAQYGWKPLIGLKEGFNQTIRYLEYSSK